MKALPAGWRGALVASSETVRAVVDAARSEGQSLAVIRPGGDEPRIASWSTPPEPDEVLEQMRAAVLGEAEPVRLQLVRAAEGEVRSDYLMVVPEVDPSVPPSVTEGVLLAQCLAHIKDSHREFLTIVKEQSAVMRDVVQQYRAGLSHAAAEQERLQLAVEEERAARERLERDRGLRDDAMGIVGESLAALLPSASTVLQAAADTAAARKGKINGRSQSADAASSPAPRGPKA